MAKKRKNKNKYPEVPPEEPAEDKLTWGFPVSRDANPYGSMGGLFASIMGGPPPRPRVVTDCAREIFDDRERTEGYLHNAYTSTHHDLDTRRWFSGFVVSVVDHDELGSLFAGKQDAPPISIAVAHNVTGANNACVAYFSAEEAKQIVNQLSHAIGQAELAKEEAVNGSPVK
jgi:hypothetical protein